MLVSFETKSLQSSICLHQMDPLSFKSMTNHASSSTNAQATTTLDLLSCAFCGQSGHFIAQCLVCADYITNEKCKRNPEGKIVLPNGQYTPHSITGQFIKDRIDK
jgi:hypothetical protein